MNDTGLKSRCESSTGRRIAQNNRDKFEELIRDAIALLIRRGEILIPETIHTKKTRRRWRQMLKRDSIDEEELLAILRESTPQDAVAPPTLDEAPARSLELLLSRWSVVRELVEAGRQDNGEQHERRTSVFGLWNRWLKRQKEPTASGVAPGRSGSVSIGSGKPSRMDFEIGSLTNDQNY
jgi:hypothetical protein